MKPPLLVRALSEAEAEGLRAASRQTADGFALRRAQIVLARAAGRPVADVAAALGCAGQTVRNAIRAFNARGLESLSAGSHRTDKAVPVLDAARREGLRAILGQSPRAFGKAQSLWTLTLAAEVAHEQGLTPTVLNHESVRVAVGRLGLNWKRLKGRLQSPDAGYARKKSAATD